MDHLLTFEYDPKGELLRVHADSSGLAALIDQLTQLKKSIDQGELDHLHLMSEAWAGDELSPDPQDLSGDSTFINHVKIHGYPEKQETTEQDTPAPHGAD